MPQRKKTDWDRFKEAYPALQCIFEAQTTASAIPSSCPELHEAFPHAATQAQDTADGIMALAASYGMDDPSFLNVDRSVGRAWTAFPFDAAIAILDTAFRPSSPIQPFDSPIEARAYSTLLHDEIRRRIYAQCPSMTHPPIRDFFIYLALCRWEPHRDAPDFSSSQIAKRYNLGSSLRQYYSVYGGYLENSAKASQRTFGGPVLLLQLTCLLFSLHWAHCQAEGREPFWDEQSFLELKDIAINVEKGDPGKVFALFNKSAFLMDECTERMAIHASASIQSHATTSAKYRVLPLKYREPVAVAIELCALPPAKRPLSEQSALDLIKRGCSADWTMDEAFLSDIRTDPLRLYTLALCIATRRFDAARAGGYLVTLFGSSGAPATGDYHKGERAKGNDGSPAYVRAFLYSHDGERYRLAQAQGHPRFLRVDSPLSDSPAIRESFQEPQGDDVLYISSSVMGLRCPDGHAVRIDLVPRPSAQRVGSFEVIPFIVPSREEDLDGRWNRMTADLRSGSPVPLDVEHAIPHEKDFDIAFCSQHPAESPASLAALSANGTCLSVEDGYCARGTFALSRSRKGALCIRNIGTASHADIFLWQENVFRHIGPNPVKIDFPMEFTVIVLRMDNPSHGMHSFHFRLPAVALEIAEARLAKIQQETTGKRALHADEEYRLNEVRDAIYEKRAAPINRCDWYPAPHGDAR